MKKIILFAIVCAASASSFAQDSTNTRKSSRTAKSEKRQRINSITKQEEEGNLSFSKQSVFGVQLRTNGYGVFYELGKRRSPRFTNLYTVELTEIKHRKEDKIGGAENFFSNSYIYGKENNFYQLKLGYGQQYILGQKGNKNGVAITLNVNGGLSMGLLKPYYLQVLDSNGSEKTIRYSEDTVAFLDRGAIVGGGGFTKGWGELKLKPGVFVRSALRFDFGRYNEKVNALEVGISLEYYAQKIPILLLNDPKGLYFQGHVAYVFGGRKR